MSIVSIYEDNAGGVYLQRDDGPVWALGPVTDDMHGGFRLDAIGWIDGDWEPGENNGQHETGGTEDLELIADYISENGPVQRHALGGFGAQLYVDGRVRD